jgi:hypothetical protein
MRTNQHKSNLKLAGPDLCGSSTLIAGSVTDLFWLLFSLCWNIGKKLVSLPVKWFNCHDPIWPLLWGWFSVKFNSYTQQFTWQLTIFCSCGHLASALFTSMNYLCYVVTAPCPEGLPTSKVLKVSSFLQPVKDALPMRPGSNSTIGTSNFMIYKNWPWQSIALTCFTAPSLMTPVFWPKKTWMYGIHH